MPGQETEFEPRFPVEHDCPRSFASTISPRHKPASRSRGRPRSIAPNSRGPGRRNGLESERRLNTPRPPLVDRPAILQPDLQQRKRNKKESVVSRDCKDTEKKSLKLYVVGELSGDPNRWSRFSKRSFVLASTPEEALEMSGSGVVCAEVDCSQPLVLFRDEGGSEFSNLAVLLEAAGVADHPASEI
jgi:hypothetical protein